MEKFVLTGGSAGGISTYLWADYAKSLFCNKTEFYAIPDSAIFLDPTKPLPD